MLSFNVVPGLQLKVDPDGPDGDPPITTEPTPQILVSGPALAVGKGLTVTTTVSVLVQLFASVPVTT